MKIAVIGGGASGVLAAITAAERGAKPVIFEAGGRVLSKLLKTGNGRCNYTNKELSEANYTASDAEFVRKVLRIFPTEKAVDFMRGIGIETVFAANGCAYPRSGQASAVADMLRFKLAALKVETGCGCAVDYIAKDRQEFLVNADGRLNHFDRVIYAAGSNASLTMPVSELGIIAAMGHTVSPFEPALVQLRTEKDEIRGMEGQRAEVSVKAVSEGRTLGSRRGEILFTDYGLSGIAVMSLSHLANRHKTVSIEIDFMPDTESDTMMELITGRKRSLSYLATEDFLSGLFPKRVGLALIKGLPPKVANISEAGLKALCGRIKRYSIKVTGTNGIRNSQACTGGVSLSEIDPETMESKLISGLYFSGEAMDCTGDCGGYNLHWAWATGFIAGKSAGEAL